MKTWANIRRIAAGVALLVAPGCSGKFQDSNEPSPAPGAGLPAGGGGSTILPMTGTSGSTYDNPPPLGVGGLPQIGCSAIAFSSGATITTTAPFSLPVAQAGVFHVCRNAECYDGTFGTGNGFFLQPSSPSAPEQQIGVSLSSDLVLSWTKSIDDGTFEDGDHYRLTFDSSSATDSERITLIDTTVVYVHLPGNTCTGPNSRAQVDLRGSAIPMGTAGAADGPGARGAAAGAGGAAFD